MKQLVKNPVFYRILSIPVSLLVLLLVYVLQTPNPMMLLIIPVVFFTYSDGYIGGILSGLAAFGYSLVFFSNPGQLFVYNDLNMQKVMTIIAAVSVVIFLVGSLKRSNAAHVAQLRKANDNFLKILNGMDVQLLVTEPETDNILFANDKMNRSYDVDYTRKGSPAGKFTTASTGAATSARWSSCTKIRNSRSIGNIAMPGPADGSTTANP